MTALLTDEEISEAADNYCEGTSNPSTFIAGAEFARSIYEARLAEDAKVRAGLVATLQNLVSAICKVQDWDGTRVGYALDDVEAALAPAKMVE